MRRERTVPPRRTSCPEDASLSWAGAPASEVSPTRDQPSAASAGDRSSPSWKTIRAISALTSRASSFRVGTMIRFQRLAMARSLWWCRLSQSYALSASSRSRSRVRSVRRMRSSAYAASSFSRALRWG